MSCRRPAVGKQSSAGTSLVTVHIHEWMRPVTKELSHGLTKCPPDTLLHQCAHWCRPFESYPAPPKKKNHTIGVVSFLVETGGLEPSTSCV